MLVGASPRRVAIVGGARIPFARGNGAYAQAGNQEMLVAALRGVVERFGLIGQRRRRRCDETLESMEFDARVRV
jgi:acetyl-CoA C-acetyltransferase